MNIGLGLKITAPEHENLLIHRCAVMAPTVAF